MAFHETPIYDATDLKYLKEFHDLTFVDSVKWKSTKSRQYRDATFRLDTIPCGQNKVPIVRGSFILTNNREALPWKFVMYLMRKNNIFHHFTTTFATEEISNQRINAFKCIVEDKVAPNSSIAKARSWIFHEIFALCDQQGRVVRVDEKDPENNKKWPKMMGIMRSVDYFKYHELRSDKEKTARGTFYRSGYGMESMGNDTVRVYVTLEMDIGGDSLVSWWGNSANYIETMVVEVLYDIYNMFSSIAVWTDAVYGLNQAHQSPMVISKSESKANAVMTSEEHKCSECDLLREEVSALKRQLESLNEDRVAAEKSRVPDIRHHKEWTLEQIMEWMGSLEDGRFKRYLNGLRLAFNAEGIDGSSLQQIDRAELKGWGVDVFADRSALEKHIQSLCTTDGNEQPLCSLADTTRSTGFDNEDSALSCGLNEGAPSTGYL